MLIGILPKDSLLTWLFFIVVMISTANLFCALVSGFVFSWIGFALDPATHQLGGLVLTSSYLESTWTWLYELPLVPWTRFNNTVVMGNLIVGLALFVPIWFSSHWFFRTWGPALHCRLCRHWFYRWLVAPAQFEPEGKAA